MATPAQWITGARPRTLPNAVAPVVAGTGAAAFLDSAVWWKAVLALSVAPEATASTSKGTRDWVRSCVRADFKLSASSTPLRNAPSGCSASKR